MCNLKNPDNGILRVRACMGARTRSFNDVNSYAEIIDRESIAGRAANGRTRMNGERAAVKRTNASRTRKFDEIVKAR